MLPYLGKGWEKDITIQQPIFGALQCAEEASHEVMELIDRLVREKQGNGLHPLPCFRRRLTFAQRK